MILYGFTALTETQLSKLKAFEEKTGKIVLAIKPMEVSIDTLSEQELRELQALEAEIGDVILVVK